MNAIAAAAALALVNTYGTEWYKSGGFPPGTFTNEKPRLLLPSGIELVIVPWSPEDDR